MTKKVFYVDSDWEWRDRVFAHLSDEFNVEVFKHPRDTEGRLDEADVVVTGTLFEGSFEDGDEFIQKLVDEGHTAAVFTSAEDYFAIPCFDKRHIEDLLDWIRSA